MTLPQASREYGPPYTTLRDLCLRGLLPFVRLGDPKGKRPRIWIRRADLERLIEASTERGER